MGGVPNPPPLPPPSGNGPDPLNPPSKQPQPADAQETVIRVPVPEGQVNLLDPAVIAEEVKHGNEQNEAEYGDESNAQE